MPRSFEVYTVDTAPTESRPRLQQVARTFGFVPNLAGVLAESPVALKTYFDLAALFEKTSLSSAERQVVLLAVSRENGCEYCMAAHTVAARMRNIPDKIVDSLRSGTAIADPKLEALHAFVTAVVRQRGAIEDWQLQAFLDAGYTRQSVLDVIVGVAMKTVSNYTNHIVHTPIDGAFAAGAWTPEPAAYTVR